MRSIAARASRTTSTMLLVRQRRHAGGHHFGGVEDRAAAGGEGARDLIFFASVTGGDAGDGGTARPQARRHRAHGPRAAGPDARASSNSRPRARFARAGPQALRIHPGVEFFEDVEDRLGRAGQAQARACARHADPRRRRKPNLVWALRKAGLSLLTGPQGDGKTRDRHRRRGRAPGGIAGVCRGAAIADGAAGLAGLVLRPRGGGPAARAADAGSAHSRGI